MIPNPTFQVLKGVIRLAMIPLALVLVACDSKEFTDEGSAFSPDSPRPLSLAVTTVPLLHGVRIEGRTNLPDSTDLMLSVQRGPVVGGTKVGVLEGRFSADIYPRQGEAIPPGEYEVAVSTPLADFQPPPVKAALGPDYKAITGPLLVKSMFGGRIIEYETKVQLGGPSNPAADKAARQRAYKEFEANMRRGCERLPEDVERLSGIPADSGNRAERVESCLREMEDARKELMAEGLIEP